MSLYLKYRPESFEDVVGNEAQLKSVQRLIAKDDRPHVFLLQGPSGTGKTTVARIMARAIGAEGTDIKEINSSNNRGIDTAREIQDKMMFCPSEGSATAFIIDEVHQTTKDWQNAMLKPLEDTPEHVYFFLCTTDPQKLLPAIKSRCSEVKLSSLSPDNLCLVLRRVNRAESLGLSKDMLMDIVEIAGGSPRKALVILERVAAIEDEKERGRYILSGAPDSDEKEVIDLCRALLAKDTGWSDITALLKTVPMDEPERVRYAILGYMNAVLCGGKKNDRAANALEYFSEPTYNTGKSGITLAAYKTLFLQ